MKGKLLTSIGKKIPLIFSIFFIFNDIHADPYRVARLSYMDGAVTFAPAGQNNWVYAKLNRPLINGNRLWSDTKSRAELQLGPTTLRLGANTSLAILNLDKKTAQFQLDQGTLNLRVWNVRGMTYEIDTPNLAFSIQNPGIYRIDVNPKDNTTQVSIRNGQGIAFGQAQESKNINSYNRVFSLVHI